MLHESAVSPALLKLLRRFQPFVEDHGFALAGGTSLALRLGHRISTDLDWFTVQAFEPEALATDLGIGPDSIIGVAAGTLRLRADDIKVEFLRHAYPRLKEDDRMEGLSLWSLQDVAAMKLNAIANRGSKKDFFDLAALLSSTPLPDLLGHYRAKYRPASMLMLIRSLVWFEDADSEPDPISLSDCSWESVKECIRLSVRDLK